MTAALPAQQTRLRLVALGASVASLVQGVALLVGVPYALVRFVGNPLPARLPSFEEVRLAVELRDFSDRLIIGALAIAVWMCWGLFVSSAIVHVADRARNVAHRRPRLIPPAIHRVVGRWIGTAGLIVTMLGRPAQAASPNRPIATVTAPTTTNVPTTTLPSNNPAVAQPVGERSSTVGGERTYTITGRDSLWSIAEATLGDGGRWKDILDANHSLIADPDVLPDGATITIPGPTTRRVPHEVVVERGENMWNLAEEHLEQHLGHAPTNAQIAPHWLDVIETNSDTITSGDPDLIYPGERLEIPLLNGETDSPLAAPVAEPERVAATEPTTVPTTPPAVVAIAPVTTTTTAQASATRAATTEEADNAPWLLALGLSGVGAATVLSALYAKRRRAMRQQTPGDPIATPTEAQRTLISELRGISAPQRIPAVDRSLRYLWTQAASSEILPEATLIRVGDNSVELLVDDAANHCPPGFAVLDDATLVIHPDTAAAEVDECQDDAFPLCPALVSIGSDDIGDLLIDLERTGTLVIEAESPEDAEDVTAAIAAEVASHPWAKDNTIYSIGLDHVAALPGITKVDDIEVLIDQLERSLEGIDEELRATGTHRARLEAVEISPATIVLIGAEQRHAAERLSAVAVRGSGVAIVSAAPVSTATWRLVVTGRSATLEPKGLEITPALLARQASAAVATLLGDCGDDHRPQGTDGSNGHRFEGDPRSTDELIAEILAPQDVELILLDEVPRLEGVAHNGKNAARADEVVAFLALHGPACPRQVGEALWPGRRNSAEQVSQAVSRTRTILGNHDGRPRLVPARRNAPYRLEGVGCDWTRFRDLTRLAGARPDDEVLCLAAALELVIGSPFAGRRERAFEWVADLGYESDLRLAVVDVAVRVAEARMRDGDHNGAIAATSAGRLAVADHEGLLRLRVTALAATGDSTSARLDVGAALQSVRAEDGLLADLDPATRQIFETVLRPNESKRTATSGVAYPSELTN